MPEFFLELFSEEIPSRMQESACQALIRLCNSAFSDLSPKRIQAFAGPRRLAITLDIDSVAPETQSIERGPRVNAPEQALLGFMRKHNATKELLFQEDGYWFLRGSSDAITAEETIINEIPSVVTQIPWQKSMRWGQGAAFTWIRPLRSVICLLDGEVVPIEIGPITAGNETQGHPLLAPNFFEVSSTDDWIEKLRTRFVVVDQDDRWQVIERKLSKHAADLCLAVVEDSDLLEEVAGLVEWPVPLIGKIDENFMSLPPEVRELSMKVNQKYFALRDAEGKPAPYFAFVANLEAPDGGAAIVAGNERVLRARLADARHFWDRDLQTPLDALLPKLDGIVFHAKIGTQLARAERISKLAREIAEMLGADEFTAIQAEWAGRLCKADLVTGMVGEFPELQGTMGGYYAECTPRGWDGDVVGPAIKTHYQPKGPSDTVPAGIVAVSVALADKIDTLMQFFRIGEVPTGSGDPYALRRAALGVIRVILENDLRLPLRRLLHSDEKLLAFIRERLRVKLRSEGLRFDVLDAVLGIGGDDDLARIMRRVAALTDFITTDDGKNLLVSFRRADNILKIEDAKDGPHNSSPVERLLELPEEKELNQLLGTVMHAAILEYRVENYFQALTALSTLRLVVDAFFEKITINAPEPALRLNRLRLLAGLRNTVYLIADFSKIEA